MATVDEPIPPGQDPWISQTDHPRCVVDGQRTDESGKCTVIAIRVKGGYEVYPHGAEGLCVHLDAKAARKLSGFLGGGS